MLVKAPNCETMLQIPLEEPRVCENLIVSVWGDECEASEISEDASKWFSDYLESPNIRLVRISDSFERKTDPKYAPKGQTCFADGFPFLLASQESLVQLNSKLVSQSIIFSFSLSTVYM